MRADAFATEDSNHFISLVLCVAQVSVIMSVRSEKDNLRQFTECDDGLYGYKCTEKCGSCRNFEPCVKSIGVCEGGCLQDNMIKPFCKTGILMK